ncbi:MAG: hypothetical protein AB1480_10935, partial [Nitrospirota bacterium]
AAMYGQYIKDIIDLSGTSKTVKFFDQTGTNSFADGDTTYNGVCEVCHTQTTHFQNTGGGSDQLHANVGGAGGTNCISCHVIQMVLLTEAGEAQDVGHQAHVMVRGNRIRRMLEEQGCSYHLPVETATIRPAFRNLRMGRILQIQPHAIPATAPAEHMTGLMIL